MSKDLLEKTNFIDLPEPVRGKVRDIFDLQDRLIIVTTDRISAYDFILPNGIPGKGKVLNRISEFWFGKTGGIIDNHLISTDVDDFPHEFHRYADELEGRSMLVKKTKPLEIECIVRGYLSGLGWNEYRDTGAVCEITLPKGLLESSKLDAPVFTPSTKAVDGDHDENISFERACEIIGVELANKVRETSINIYSMARDYAIDKGIIIADTKFEFGIEENTEELILIDEVLTPDSSRFWPSDDYEPGRGQKSFDKQFVRDYLNSTNWDRTPPAPGLPADIVQKTKAKYESMICYLLND